MGNIDLLKLSYNRIISTEEVTLTDDNYEKYGYLKDDNGYYKLDENGEKEHYTTIEVDVYQKYEHILPNPSTYDMTYSDVDKEGSGRKSSNGLMVRERIGHYCSLDVKWNVIPNTQERINLLRILRNLPPQFTLEYHDSDNDVNTTTVKEFYRADISESLYLFTQDRQIWQGLSTNFIQFNVDSYDDSVEPTLLELTIRRFNNKTKVFESKHIDRSLLYTYLNSNDGDGIWELINE